MIKKRTLKMEVLDDLHIALIFKIDLETEERGMKAIIPEIRRGEWEFTDKISEDRLGALFGGLSHEFVTHARPAPEVADKFVILMKRAVDGLLIKRVED